MSIAIISDIHANKEAFDTFLAAIYRNKSVTGILNLGDVVGYSADPEYCLNTCLEMERDGTMVNILGNHEAVLLDKYSKLLDSFNPVAKIVTAWTKDRITLEQIVAIKKWPLQIIEGKIAYAHGQPKKSNQPLTDNEEEMILSTYTASRPLHGVFHPKGLRVDRSRIYRAFAEMQTTDFDIWFVGHYHCQQAHMLKKGQDPVQCQEIPIDLGETLELRKDYRYILTPGSVGRPKIRTKKDDLRAGYLIFNEKERLVNFLRKEFDKKLTADKIRAQPGIPSIYADIMEGC